MTRAWGSRCDPWIDAVVKWQTEMIDESPATTKGVKTMTEHKLPFPAPAIKRVIFNAPATIVLWEDGSKTVVKAHNEAFDPEKGLAMAVCKRIYGGKYHSLFKKWCPEEKAADEAPAPSQKKNVGEGLAPSLVSHPAEKREIRKGDKVKFTGEKPNDAVLEYYPDPGTIGTVEALGNSDALVQWPEGATKFDGRWWAELTDLEVVE